jgi:hypothetical protein
MTMVDAAVFLQDNGLTCFAPPCFHWDLIDPDTHLVIKRASEIDTSSLSEEKLAVASATLSKRAPLLVEGHLEARHKLGPPQFEAIVFVVESVR